MYKYATYSRISPSYQPRNTCQGKNGGWGGGNGKKKKRLMKIVATTSFASSRTPTAGMPPARAKMKTISKLKTTSKIVKDNTALSYTAIEEIFFTSFF